MRHHRLHPNGTTAGAEHAPSSPLRISRHTPPPVLLLLPPPFSLSLSLSTTIISAVPASARRGASTKGVEKLIMDSDIPAASIVDGDSQLAEIPANGSDLSKKKQGRVPKRIQKSEREKMKREHLNELFLALADVLGVSEQNNGKASILGETTRLLKEMHAQIEILRGENAALLSESQYVMIEKNELLDENSTLEAQIGKLQIELEERGLRSKPDLNVPPPEESTPQFSVEPLLQQPPYVNPVYVIPVCSDLQAYPEHGAAELASKPTSNVSKPHARYPTASDSWPSQLLGKQPESSNQFRCNDSSSNDVAV